MRFLYHHWLSPGARAVRVLLKEKGLDFELRLERAWERRPEFLAINPSGEVPVLVEPDGLTLVEPYAIAEHIEERYPDRPLSGVSAAERAEVRRLVWWFDVKFAREVTQNLYEEKVIKRLTGHGTPNSQAIRAGYQNIHVHLDYIDYLTDRRKYLAGDGFGRADIVAAAHISTLDYLSEVPWDDHEGARNWYARVKSRPSFRPILADHVPGQAPPPHYADPDF